MVDDWHTKKFTKLNNRMIKKITRRIFLFLLTLSFLFIWSGYSFANEVVEIKIFTSQSCPHCSSAKTFLKNFESEIKELNWKSIKTTELDFSKNLKTVKKLYEEYWVSTSQQWLVPAIFLWEKYFIWFNEQIEKEIKEYILEQETTIGNDNKHLITLPIVWEVDIFSFSLPLLAVVLWIVDWFNVCSLWALLVILWLVIVLKSRKKIILMWGTFLLTSAIMYWILILLRHQLFSFIAPYIKSMELLIWILAISGWIYLLREFYKAYKSWPICSSNNLMSRLVPKIKKIFQEKTNRIILFWAIMLFAIIVTVIEFPCSAFLPVLFTSILADSGVSFGVALLYIWLYMFMYLLDEMIIFAIAIITLKIKIVSPKFITFFNLLAAFIFIWLWLYFIIWLF